MIRLVKSRKSAAVAAIFCLTPLLAWADPVNFSFNGTVDQDFLFNPYDVVTGDTVSVTGMFDDDVLTGIGEESVLFGSGNNTNMLQIDIAPAIYDETDDHRYLDGEFPTLHFLDGSLVLFDYQNLVIPDFQSGSFGPGSEDIFFSSDFLIGIWNYGSFITTPKAPPEPGGLDHFKCYEVEDGNDVGVTVSLEDQFGLAVAEVEEAELFCNPVDKNDEGILDETAHLTGYELDDDDEDFDSLEVTVTNQLGEEQVLVLEEPELLLVPSEKDGVASDLKLDHFKCYQVEDGDDVELIVSLQDQFDSEPDDILVGDPKLFCNPVNKNGEGILDPLAHLACYEIEDEEVDQGVLVINQLDNQFLELEEAELLCVPSEKLAVVPHGDDDDDDSDSDSDRRSDDDSDSDSDSDSDRRSDDDSDSDSD